MFSYHTPTSPSASLASGPRVPGQSRLAHPHHYAPSRMGLSPLPLHRQICAGKQGPTIKIGGTGLRWERGTLGATGRAADQTGPSCAGLGERGGGWSTADRGGRRGARAAGGSARSVHEFIMLK